ncbi:hypothetical protein Hypma_001028 [Hypsizygus marmoreus]|uniref:Uncharacterized protein n=1 Tax=Hypsizygus marmoreus TaxID=39966 RepID=A0A369JAX3_HYPMA|nr:hypothetical protein Hypma_001028 [Hypsizygus marmoreus]
MIYHDRGTDTWSAAPAGFRIFGKQYDQVTARVLNANHGSQHTVAQRPLTFSNSSHRDGHSTKLWRFQKTQQEQQSLAVEVLKLCESMNARDADPLWYRWRVAEDGSVAILEVCEGTALPGARAPPISSYRPRRSSLFCTSAENPLTCLIEPSADNFTKKLAGTSMT